ncbi:MAG: hypothetical protein LC687_03980, partial [Actinobacteria bacterium]|nr:hypothetical protein [Actinomycetota bacterium]
SKTVLSGFSLGAMVAFIAAANKNPSALWLYSLSPFFAEDLSAHSNPEAYQVGKRRVRAFESVAFKDMVSQIYCQTALFAGENEPELLRHRCEQANKLIKNSKLNVIPNCGHDVTDDKYIHSIKNNT